MARRWSRRRLCLTLTGVLGSSALAGCSSPSTTGGVGRRVTETDPDDVDPAPDPTWTVRFRSDRPTGGSRIHAGSDGYAVAGATGEPGQEQAWMGRVTTGGSTQWQRRFESESGIGWAVDVVPADSGYLLAGGTYEDEPSGWLRWLDLDGNERRRTTLQPWPSTTLGRVATVPDGYVLAGSASPAGLDEMAWARGIDGEGATRWERTFGRDERVDEGDEGERFNGAIPAHDGGVVCFGETNDFGREGFDAWLVALGPNQEERWRGTYRPGEDVGVWTYDAARTGDGGYVLTGSRTSYIGRFRGWIGKVDGSGGLAWTYYYPDQHNEFQAVAGTPDGGCLVGGKIAPNSGREDGPDWIPDTDYDELGWIRRFEPDGQERWHGVFPDEGVTAIQGIEPVGDGGYLAAGVAREADENVEANEAWVGRIDLD